MKVRVKYLAFFFECCQNGAEKIVAANVNKQYMALYSSSPSTFSFHYDGVGLLMLCIEKMLNDGYQKPFNYFQQDLRARHLQKMIEVLKIPVDHQESFKENNLPVHTSTMFDEFNLHTKACDASMFC